MNPEKTQFKSMGITLRTALLSWLVTTATVLIFVIMIIPMQKEIYLVNLESKARSLAVSLHNVAAGAVLNEDYSTVVDHCKEMLDGDKALDYLIITKNDGFSLINDRTGWHSETDVSKVWRPDVRQPASGIGVVPLLNRRVFYYSQPFDYSGIQWGWIHVGLSLDNYDRSVAKIYERTGILAVMCIAISLLGSVFYAKRLVQPILSLREIVREVANGKLTARAVVDRGDELGSLASSVNAMTDSLQRRDLFLESMRFAAQKFLSTSNWEPVVMEVLVKMGEASGVSRIHILQKQTGADGKVSVKQLCEWESADCPAPEPNIGQNALVLLGTEFNVFAAQFEQGQPMNSQTTTLSARAEELHKARRVKSWIALPIRVENHWWGILALADCLGERIWTDSERDSFQAVANMFGAAIGRQQTQDALIKAKESAESASQAKSQFLANMSHEIRTPITGVIGMLQLLQRTELNKPQARYATNAFTSAKTLLTVIGDVLDFSKIEAGKMELEELVFDPVEVVDTVVRLFAERAEGKGIELVYKVGDTVPRELQGDANRLRQVLVNLVGNAIKFTTSGEVVVSGERLEGKAGTTKLHFEVRDTGCGVAPDKQHLIFDAFAQADNSMTRKYGGTGLGLTISRQFCELMGGRIGVRSTPGCGSIFEFTLDFKNGSPETAAEHSQYLDLRGLRVLVVDDCATTREINREWIAAWHGQSDEAPDALQALEKLRQAAHRGERFQVAVVDWKMPGLSGMGLARAIKEDEELRKTGLVLLSSFMQQGSFEKIMAAGFAAFIPKPAGRSDLYDAIVTAANGDFKNAGGGAPEKTAVAPVAPVHMTGTILLAEDNEINREVATEMLAALGYASRWVRNGREAVAAWRGHRADLILMDCQMPEMDGYEATRVIRAEEGSQAEAARIPIVALTAHATNSDRDRCLTAGMDDYLTKPLDRQALALALARWMPVKAAAWEAAAAIKPAATVKPAAARGGQTGPIDFESLLRRCLNKRELAARLVRKLIEQAAVDIPAMAAAVQQNEAAALAASAHRLKGASANVSAEELRRLAAALETLGRNGSTAGTKALLEALQQEMGRLKAAETQWLTSAG
jgi:signal transduction histidine kinase/CheY-like chemotaxis protein